MPRSIIFPAAFIALIVVLTGGVWLYQTLSAPVEGGARPSTRSGGFFGSLFPFGSGTADTDPKTIGENGGDTTLPIPTVRHVTEVEVSGSTFARSQGSLVLRYVERETGHIYETPVDSWSATRLTNTTVPAVHEALWISASSTILRFVGEQGEIENFLGFFSSTTPDQSLQGSYVAGYTRFAVAAGGGAVAGVLESSNGSSIEVVSAGGAPRTILTSPIRSWVPVAAGNTLYVASAPSSGMNGTVFSITAGVLSKVVGDLPGLEALGSRSGSRLLLSAGSRRAMSLSVVTIADGRVTALPRATLVDKCAWVGVSDTVLCAVPTELPLANYPDDWHLGRVHTKDELWFINTATGVAAVAVALDENLSLDIDDITVTTDGSYAAFVNRTDGSLWLAELGTRD